MKANIIRKGRTIARITLKQSTIADIRMLYNSGYYVVSTSGISLTSRCLK